MTRRKAVVVGLGVSGRAVCQLLLRQGFAVIGSDVRERHQFGSELDFLEQSGCQLHLGGHTPEDFSEAEQIIVSPGVPLDLEFLETARSRGVEVIGELDWAWRQAGLPVVAVTGTNGKTTTTSLIGQMFEAAGKRIFLGGNIGTPLSQWLLQKDAAELLILEVSSFQLDSAARFCPEIGVLLNVTADHLDRYRDFSAYAASKFSLFTRQNASQLAILNGDDPLCRARFAEIPGRLLFFSREDPAAHARIENRTLLVNVPGKAPFTVDLQHALLTGRHNEENLMAAALVAVAMDLPVRVICEVIQQARGLAHRVEWVRTWHGIDFYDDSKATNVGAVVKALQNFERPVWVLLGGRDKLGSYGPLVEALVPRAKGALVFGEAATRLQQELGPWFPTVVCEDLEQAFMEAIRQAQPGDVVLLSPACSSFDQYASYAQRGAHFKQLVNQLPARAEECK